MQKYSPHPNYCSSTNIKDNWPISYFFKEDYLRFFFCTRTVQKVRRQSGFCYCKWSCIYILHTEKFVIKFKFKLESESFP